MLIIWNTLHRKLEEFNPINPGRVGLYTCGPTVYNPATIGNLRTYVFEDILERVLRLEGYKVKHVMNITDVGHLTNDSDNGEDKMEREALRQGKDIWEIAKMYEARFDQDMRRLNVLVPEGENRPHATEYIPEQIALIQKLEERGYTYKTSDGIYFDTSLFANYGKLSGQKLEEKEAGARVEVNEEKKHPTDFALWKFSPADQKRQMEWESPWGVGFPGWHIECSAMSQKLLDQPFDIHCGGVDHIAIHHENEIAQSEAAYSTPLANYWMHSEFLLVDGKRMGKSEGNAYTLDDLEAKGFQALDYRYFCLLAHYRSKLNFTWEALEAAHNALQNLLAIIRRLPEESQVERWSKRDEFLEAIESDLNTSAAIAVLWEVLKSDVSPAEKTIAVREMDQVLALGLAEQIGKQPKAPDEVIGLAEQRLQVRAAKDWQKSDELRDQIKALGWEVKDGADGYELEPISK